MPRTSGSAKARVYRMSTRIELCCSMRGVALVASEAPSWSSKSTSTIKTPVHNNYHPRNANEPVSKGPAEACPQVTYQRLGSAASLAAAGQHQCRTVLQVATDWITAPHVLLLLLVMVRVGQLCTGGAGQHTQSALRAQRGSCWRCDIASHPANLGVQQLCNGNWWQQRASYLIMSTRIMHRHNNDTSRIDVSNGYGDGNT